MACLVEMGRKDLPDPLDLLVPLAPAVYTRWGKSSCPQVAGIELVYSGGSLQNQQGGGANHLCMPTDRE